MPQLRYEDTHLGESGWLTRTSHNAHDSLQTRFIVGDHPTNYTATDSSEVFRTTKCSRNGWFSRSADRTTRQLQSFAYKVEHHEKRTGIPPNEALPMLVFAKGTVELSHEPYERPRRWRRIAGHSKCLVLLLN
jgi:hypothetical protein